MTTYRNHPLDVWMRGFFAPVICMILVGLPPYIWVWLAILWDVTLNLSHLEVNWTYGPLRWLFGTADRGTARPAAVGLPGWTVGDSIFAHLWAPVRGVVRHYRGLP